MRGPPASITLIVIFALVTITTLVMGALGVINYSHARTRELEHVRLALALDADQIALSLPLPLGKSDRPQIEEIVAGMMRDPIIATLVVSSADGAVILARERDAQWRIQPMEKPASAEGPLVEKRRITLDGQRVATVTLTGTTKFMEVELRKTLLWTVANILALDLILVGSLYLLLYHWVFKPLRALETYAASGSAGGSTGPVRAFRGELESLRASIEKMLGLVNSRFQALRDSEEKFSKAFQANPSGIIISEVETGHLIEVNESFARLFGYVPQEMIGRTTLELGIWENEAHRESLTRAIRANRSLRDFEVEVRTRTGECRTILVNTERIELGGKEYLLSLIQDITERKRTEEMLREKQAQLIFAMDISRLAHWEFDVAKNLVTGDEKIFQLLGTTPEKEGGFSMSPEDYIRKFVHPLDAALVASEVAMGVATTDPNFAREFEHRVIRADGTEGVMLMRARVMQSVDGRTIKILGTNQDITERKRNEERMRRLVESNVEGVVFWNSSGAVTEANDAYLKIVGYTREDLAAGHINLVAMTPSEYAEKDEQIRKMLEATGTSKPREKEYIRKDGTRVPVLVGSAMFAGDSGEGVSFVLDLTERKELEKQFLRAQRMDSIGTLASGVAHDLNNILSPILMSAQVLRMDIPAKDREEIVATIEASATRGSQIVKQVLTFGRGLEGDKRPLQLETLVEEMVNIIRATFPKDVTVDCKIEPRMWTVLGDATQLHQVLLNLCVNARDAMPDGGKLQMCASNREIDAAFANMLPESTPGPHVLLEVSDSGSGISPDVIDRIFDPFFSTKGPGKGTGLGLSTVHGIIKSHGGFIKVVSEAGRGTAFQVWLPAVPETDTSLDAASLATPPTGRGERVLVVDDEPAVSGSVKTVLESHGYQVSLASDGPEALAVFTLNRDSIALVIADILMPHMSGWVLIRALRQIKPGVPIIASTGLGEESHLSDLEAVSVGTMLRKPYDANMLLHTVHKVLHPTKPESGASHVNV